MTTLLHLARAHWRTALGAALGATGGATYAHFVGCRTGTCPLTSSVWTAGLFFGLAGGLVGWPAKRAEQAPPERRGARESR
ncbi:MAG TPA: hypothetical protein VFR85_15250 [Anaeromyxobacteraceae bacterium]|nr:hypothetical protein [Anaeromyxobacteraceae bacterium]